MTDGTWFTVYRKRNGRYGWICHRCTSVGTEKYEPEAWARQWEHMCTSPPDGEAA